MSSDDRREIEDAIPTPRYSEGPKAIVGLSIGEAVEALRAGMRASRAGWNGKGMWLALAYPTASSEPAMTLPFVYMRTASGELVPWLCSASDLLATDWEIFP